MAWWREFFKREVTAPMPQVTRPALSMQALPIDIETEVNDQGLQQLLAHTQATWTRLGDEEPHWSVISDERFKQGQVAEHLAEFYDSGRNDVETFVAFLRRNSVAPGGLHRVLEFGCGLGRVTRYLAERFEHVQACDISSSHLRQAQAYLDGAGVRNVDCRRVTQLADIQGPADMDAVFTVIVLQHNPPPAIAAILQALLGRLKPGGVAYFQVPTYASDYSFKLDDYLARGLDSSHVEMHYLPQRHVFQIAARAGCDVLEVREDDWVGRRHMELSNTFLLRKR